MPWRQRPPWWPESETWPPQGPEGWRGVRRHFARRIGLFLAAVVLLAVMGGGTLFWLGTRFGAGGPNAGHRFAPAGFFVTVLILVGLIALIRSARRAAGPVGDVMDGAARVAAGDYAVRVKPRGPREVRQLGRSFNAMAERLEATERARRQLFADVAHELRTPLTVVQANVEGSWTACTRRTRRTSTPCWRRRR